MTMMMAMKAFVVVMTTTNMESNDHNDAAADDADDNGDHADSGAAGSGGSGLRLALHIMLSFSPSVQHMFANWQNFYIKTNDTKRNDMSKPTKNLRPKIHLQYFSFRNKQTWVP